MAVGDPPGRRFASSEVWQLAAHLTPLHEQACISRQARGGVWGVLTIMLVRVGALGPLFLQEN